MFGQSIRRYFYLDCKKYVFERYCSLFTLFDAHCSVDLITIGGPLSQRSVDDDWDATKTRCADELNALEHEQAELQKKFARMGTLAEQKVIWKKRVFFCFVSSLSFSAFVS